MCAFAKISNRGVWPSNKTIAEKAGVSVSTVIRACNELKAKGAIKRSDRFDRKKGQISSYTLLVGHNAECYNGTDNTTPSCTGATPPPPVAPMTHEGYQGNDIKESLQGKPELPESLQGKSEGEPKPPKKPSAIEKPTNLANEEAPEEVITPKAFQPSEELPEKNLVRAGCYSPEDAPDIMRPIARYLLDRTGRTFLKWSEISALRELAASQMPTRVQKEIDTACERLRRNGHDVGTLTFCYIAAALRNQPTYGRKARGKAEAKRKPNPMSLTQAEIDAMRPKQTREELYKSLAELEAEMEAEGC